MPRPYYPDTLKALELIRQGHAPYRELTLSVAFAETVLHDEVPENGEMAMVCALSGTDFVAFDGKCIPQSCEI